MPIRNTKRGKRSLMRVRIARLKKEREEGKVARYAEYHLLARKVAEERLRSGMSIRALGEKFNIPTYAAYHLLRFVAPKVWRDMPAFRMRHECEPYSVALAVHDEWLRGEKTLAEIERERGKRHTWGASQLERVRKRLRKSGTPEDLALLERSLQLVREKHGKAVRIAKAKWLEKVNARKAG